MKTRPVNYLKYAIVVMTIIGIYSCRKTLNELMPNAIDKKVGWAQDYYNNVLQKNEGNQVSYKLANKISAVNEIVSRPNMKSPMWIRARADKTNLFEFVEVPLSYSTKISASVGKASEKANAKVLKASFDRLIIYKDKRGKIDQRIITYVPSEAYLARHNGDISHNKINNLDRDFEGFLQYKKWDGTPLIVLMIKNGKAVKRMVPKSPNGNEAIVTTKGKLMQGPKPGKVLSDGTGGSEGQEGCIDWYWQEYSQMCYYTNPDDTYPAYCDDPVLIYEVYLYTTCPDDPGYEEGLGDFCADPANFNSTLCTGTESPCQQLNNLTGYYIFNNIMLDLRSEALSDHESIWTADFENLIYNSVDGAANSQFVSIGITNPIDMWTHNHFNGGDPMFSDGDILALNVIYTNNKIRDIGTYIHGVTTYQGTEYFLKIENNTLFSSFSSNILGNTSNFEDWSDDYYAMALAGQVYSGLTEVEAFERAFLGAIEGSGLQLYKKNFTTGAYDKMNLNPDGTTSQSNGCN